MPDIAFPAGAELDGEAEAALACVLASARHCTHCAPYLPLGPQPVVRGRASARLMILSQAPGTRAHETGLSFNDRSGDRLRDWLGLDRDSFYDERRVAIMPMGFCYPGRGAKGGDLPPRRECAPLWHERVLQHLPRLELILLVGSYAITYYLKPHYLKPGTGMTGTVARWREFLPRYLPLPHPSWRTTVWERRNPWFEAELLPDLRRRVAALT
ncbi:MAG: uracil-DNA glycosylase family protein [Stellaceae bacterium]